MDTLREIGEFIGMSPGTSLHSAGDLVVSPGEQISMREVIRRLPNLPPISLEAAAENTVGEVPFRGIVHVHSSPGVVLETQVGLFRNAQLVGAISKDTGAPARDVVFEVVDPGSYVLEVTRTGVTNTGVTQLRRTFNIQANAKPTPAPPPPNPPPPAPGINATILQQNPITHVLGTVLRVTGGPFTNGEQVQLKITTKVVDGVGNSSQAEHSSHTTADNGKIDHIESVICEAGKTTSFHVIAMGAVSKRQFTADVGC